MHLEDRVCGNMCGAASGRPWSPSFHNTCSCSADSCIRTCRPCIVHRPYARKCVCMCACASLHTCMHTDHKHSDGCTLNCLLCMPPGVHCSHRPSINFHTDMYVYTTLPITKCRLQTCVSLQDASLYAAKWPCRRPTSPV
jgi:hypothetical protein